MNFNELKLESCLLRGIADRGNTDAVPAEALAKMDKLGSVIDEWVAEALGTLWAGTSIDIDSPYKKGIISSFCRGQTNKNPYKKTRQRPTLPFRARSSTIGTEGLNFRVRNGNGCFPFVMVAVINKQMLRDGPSMRDQLFWPVS